MILAAPPGTWPPGGGEMARLTREHDWAATPLGPVEGWSQSLRTAVELRLASRFPVVIQLGPEGINLYNDAAAPLVGRAHPGDLGRSVFAIRPEASEAWRAVLERV